MCTRIRAGGVLGLLACVLAIGTAPTAAQAGGTSEARLVLMAPPSATGAPPVFVEITARFGPAGSRRVLEVGTTSLEVTLAPGHYAVMVRAGGARSTPMLLELAPGSTAELQILASPPGGAGALRARVVDRGHTTAHTRFDDIALQWLPGSGTVWSLLESVHPFVVADRIESGGITSAVPTLASGHGASWTATTFLLDGLDVTDPLRLGTPTAYPDLRVLQAVDVRDALMTAESPGPGPVVSLVPRRPAEQWTGSIDARVTTPSPARSGLEPPAIARYRSWNNGGVVGTGPLGRTAGLFASARVTRGTWVERDAATPFPNDVASVYAHVMGTQGIVREVRATVATTAIRRAFSGRSRFADRAIDEHARDTVAHLTWDGARSAGLWSVTGGFVRATTRADVPPTARGGTIERLLDGPPRALAEARPSTRERWTLGMTASPAFATGLGRRTLQLGASFARRDAVFPPFAQPPFAELVDGQPARVWALSATGSSTWSATDAALWASNRETIHPRVTLTTGLRVDVSRASAVGSAGGLAWTHVSPRVAAAWQPTGRAATVTVGYGWYRHPVLLDWLAVGDPAGTTGTVSRWDDRDGDGRFLPSELTPVAVVGLCCAFEVPNSIDSQLRRPTTKEFRIGVETEWAGWRWGVSGIDRRGRDGVGVVNVGVPVGSFTQSTVLDPGIDLLSATPSLLTIFNRSATSARDDRYVLTNPLQPDDVAQGVEITMETARPQRWFVRFGGTAYRALGAGANRGFLGTENDAGLLGESFLDPNAATSRRGRLFGDRAYVMKVAGGYEAPGGVDIGMVARYQDGQPFARVVVAPGLTQGPDFVAAYPRGGQRFTYTLTLDARVEKRLGRGRRQLGLGLDVFNLLDTRNEVEERIVTGPAFRTVTALQPPRAFRLGLNLAF